MVIQVMQIISPAIIFTRLLMGQVPIRVLTTQVATYPGNPDAKWETTFVTNIGLDFELLKRRLYGDINWYDKRTKDLFVNKTLTGPGGGIHHIG